MKHKISAPGLLGDVLRRVPLSSVTDLKVPKEMRKALLANMESLRHGALDIFAVEVSRVLSKLDVQRLVDDILKNYSLRVDAKIELIPKGRRKGRAKK